MNSLAVTECFAVSEQSENNVDRTKSVGVECTNIRRWSDRGGL